MKRNSQIINFKKFNIRENTDQKSLDLYLKGKNARFIYIYIYIYIYIHIYIYIYMERSTESDLESAWKVTP